MSEENTRTELRARIKELHTHSYLTLLSIGQAVSFHLLIEKIWDDRTLFFGAHHPAGQYAAWAAAIETFIVLVLVWNDFFMVVSIYTWIPSIIDAVILFCLFASEVAMAKTIDDPFYWLVAFAFLLFCSLAAFLNTYTQSNNRKENKLMFDTHASRMRFSMWLVGSFLATLIFILSVLAWTNTVFWIGMSLSAVMLCLFVPETIIHWNAIKKFIDGK